MKTAPRLLATSAAVLLSGCASGFDECNLMPPPGSAGQNAPAVILGNIAEFVVQPSLRSSCEAPSPSQAPDSVSVEVFDPNNHVIAAEASLANGGHSATVRFVPKTPGRHHVRVAFAPVGSVQQFGAYVAAEWPGGDATLLDLPRCTQLDRTTHGTWICDGVALHAKGGNETRLAGPSGPPDVAVVGNVVWTVGENRVRRFIDTGAELVLTGTLLLSQRDTVTIVQSRLATEEELWVLDTEHLHRFTFTSQGVVTGATPTPWGLPSRVLFGVDLVQGVLVRTGPTEVQVVQMALTPDSLACAFQVGPAGSFVASETPCQRLPGVPAGIEDSALWTRVDNDASPQPGRTLYRWAAEHGALVERGTLMVDAPIELVSAPLRPGAALPILQWRHSQVGFIVPTVPATPGALGLEAIPANVDLPYGVRTATPRFYWEAGTGRSTRVYERGESSLK